MRWWCRSIRWLGGEEAFAGIVNNEKENEVRQTKKQQALWFLATTLVVPIMVFGLGLAYALSTRRRRPLANCHRARASPPPPAA